MERVISAQDFVALKKQGLVVYKQLSLDRDTSLIFDCNGNEISFKSWIKAFLDFNSPLGDLAKEIWRDDNFPEDVAGYGDSFGDIMNYLQSKDYSYEVKHAFANAWSLYWAHEIYSYNYNAVLGNNLTGDVRV